ncbi:STN domain-containing protein [Chitinophaga caseinilytica]|uniref:STN domain-containing protein n=1 Tax=Chitinophaga caseinilytica TaxID=2267521 RepID=A0ABZ2Z3G6_9BACT
MMKLTAAILLTGFLHVSAGVYSQDRITLHMKSADLRKVLNAIEQKSGYRFLYHENLLSDMRRVDVSVENAEVLSVMERMLQYSPLAFELVNDRLIVLKEAYGGSGGPGHGARYGYRWPPHPRRGHPRERQHHRRDLRCPGHVLHQRARGLGAHFFVHRV